MAKSYNENRESVKGMSRSHGKGTETVKEIEHVGGSGEHCVRFKMPEGVVDHSNVRSTLKE
ncbi:MAG TPA: hypothetical protein VH724_15395 [Candidatus Angelobacter sp.]|jgi:hypothetical protein|nr:hypothetical protein [Candidatus Angelobacter sp.]